MFFQFPSATQPKLAPAGPMSSPKTIKKKGLERIREYRTDSNACKKDDYAVPV